MSRAPDETPPPGPDESRLDKWLWQARFFKSRTLAAALCRDGLVRVNGVATAKASVTIGPGDILSFPQGNGVRVVRVLALATRRGPAAEARGLYADIPDASPTPDRDRSASG